jgi:hypothetical protein
MESAQCREIRTLEDVTSDFSDRILPRGTLGTVVERYTDPYEAYAVDLRVPDPTLVGGYGFENVILRPEQFEFVETAPGTGPSGHVK